MSTGQTGPVGPGQYCITNPFHIVQSQDKCSTYNEWIPPTVCTDYLNNSYLFNDTVGPVTHNQGKFNNDNVGYVNRVVYSAFQDYLTNYDDIQSLVTTQDPGILNLLNMCVVGPLSCNDFLSQICQNCTPEDLSTNQRLLQLCGCYAKESLNQVNIGPCASTCDNIYAIKSDIDTTNGLPVQCNRTTCVIDQVSINVANIQNNVTVTVNQICNGCGNGGCYCVINFPSSPGSGSPGNFNLDIKSLADCSGTQCFLESNTGEEISTDCPVVQSQFITTKNILFIVLMFFVLMSLVLVAGFLFKK